MSRGAPPIGSTKTSNQPGIGRVTPNGEPPQLRGERAGWRVAGQEAHRHPCRSCTPFLPSIIPPVAAGCHELPSWTFCNRLQNWVDHALSGVSKREAGLCPRVRVESAGPRCELPLKPAICEAKRRCSCSDQNAHPVCLHPIIGHGLDPVGCLALRRPSPQRAGNMAFWARAVGEYHMNLDIAHSAEPSRPPSFRDKTTAALGRPTCRF